MRWKTRYIRTKRYSRKLLKWSGFLLLFLLIFGYIVFKSSYVQTFITQKVSSYLSKKSKTTITIQEVDFRPFDTFVLKKLLILDHHKDTMLFADDFYIEINDYDFEKMEFNLDLLELYEAYVNINIYPNETESNLIQFINHLSSKDTTSPNVSPKFYVEELVFENLKFKLWNENTPVIEDKIDYDHILLSNLNLGADNFIVQEDLIRVNTELFSFEERSGFELLGMSGQLMMDSKNMLFKYFEFETDETDINGDISLSYESFDAFSNFLEEVKLDTYFEETRVSSNDIQYFTDAVKGLDRSIRFQGDINGTVSNLNAKNLKFRYGQETFFQGEILFENLGTSSDPTINAKITNLVTFEKDIKSIPLPPFDSNKRIKTPEWLGNIGKMEFTGDFNGPTSNFKATGILKTNAGIIKSDVFFKSDTLKDETRIVGKVVTNEFNLGQILNSKDIGLLSMNGELDALAQFENNRLIFSGEIPRIDYKNYSYSNIKMDGTVRDQIFNGELNVNDSNLVFDFDGSIDFSVPNQQKYDFEAELKKANLQKINWVNRDSSTQVSGKLKVQMTGDQFEDLDGNLTLKKLTWFEKGKTYTVDSVNLNAVKEKEREMMFINSDLLIAKIEGSYNLAEIYPTMINVFSKEIPSLISAVELNNYKGGNKFSVMFKLKDYALINELFTNDLNFSDNTRLSGRFDDEQKSFILQFASDSILAGGKNIRGIKVSSNNRGNKLNLVGQAKYLQLMNSLGIDNLKFKSSILANNVDYNVSYQNKKNSSTHGDIAGFLDLNDLDTIKLGVNKSAIVYLDTVWKIDTSAYASISKELITIKDFNFISKDQHLKVNGIASENSSDSIVFNMDNFQLDGLGYLWKYLNIDIEGNTTGEFKLNGAFGDQVFTSNLEINNMKFNNQEFGLVSLKSDFIKTSGIIDLLLRVESRSKFNKYDNIVIQGNYFPFEEGKIDMKASFNNAKLEFMEKYFDGVFSDFRGGKATGEIDIYGKIDHPYMDGKLKIDQLLFSVDYLNVKYNIDGQTLSFNKDNILFKDFIISHDLHPKSKARINGFVGLDGFNNINYKMDSVILEQFYCLNTTVNENSTYYGQAYVDGLLHFSGNATSNSIGGSVSTTETIKFSKERKKYVPVHTSLELPLDQTEDLEISEFVTFVNLSDTSSKKKLIEENFDLSGLDLDFNFKINPEANIRIIFDPAVGDEINARGKGAVSMNINTLGKFNMFGDFTVTDGSYYFTLQNIIGKRFIVEPGSKISWDGDPLDAQMAINTYYKSRANLIHLIDSNSVPDYSSLSAKFDNRIPVYSNLGLNGSLWKPDLKIGITLPNGTPEEKNFLQEKIFGEDEINRQAFSLILTNQFLPLSSGVGSAVSGKTGIQNGMQFVEGQINNALSRIIHPNLDLGVDYNNVEESGSTGHLSNDELRLLAGFKYKNLSLSTDYDINNQVGDIEAEFKITEALKAKAYHKTTTDATAINNQTTTTYGLGAAYQKSFDSFKDLFRRKEEEQ